MRCLDLNGTWSQCTPFACKIFVFHTVKASKLRLKQTNYHERKSFVCLDIGYTNNGEQCRNKCKFYGPLYEEKNMCRTLAGDLDYCTLTGEFIINFLFTDRM